MKKLILPLFAMVTYAANAQFSIQPQIGMETSKTTIRSNDFSSFAPEGIQLAPRVAVRMEYKLKTGHGAFLGIATGTPAVQFNFANPQMAGSSFTSAAQGIQLRYESGYQFTTKKIAIGKQAASPQPEHKFGSGQHHKTIGYGHGSNHKALGYSYGGDHHRSGGEGRCGQRSASSRYAAHEKALEQARAAAAKNNALYMRIKPSIGLALTPSASKMETEMKNGQASYEYKTGLNTALIAGTAFEFGKGNQPKFIVSVNYVKGVGNNTQTLTTGTAIKPVVSTFRSNTSGFNVALGIPFNVGKKQVVAQKKQCERSQYKSGCRRYKI